jgi:TfoX/Sxy family transcriptional regulator of competence genes
MAYDETLARRIRAQMQAIPGLVEKKMFGGVGFIVDGNMACGVLGSDLMVRIKPEQYEEALTQPHARIFDNFGRQMKGWLQVAPAGTATEAALQAWIERGVAAAQALPKK